MKYVYKTRWWMRWGYPSLTWEIKTKNKEVYLTFDDGPHPEITPWVLDQLKKHNAKATFFCVGANYEKYPEIVQRIINEGHTIGNHTYDHKIGWKSSDKDYLDSIDQFHQLNSTKLFRPPHGRISKRQVRKLQPKFKIIMWSLLSGDFDKTLSPTECAYNTVQYTRPGSIIVFHDSLKAKDTLKQCLPKILNHFSNTQWEMKRLEDQLTA